MAPMTKLSSKDNPIDLERNAEFVLLTFSFNYMLATQTLAWLSLTPKEEDFQNLTAKEKGNKPKNSSNRQL